MAWFGLAALVALLALAPPAQALSPSEDPTDYISTHWDTETGLPHNGVKRIFQTRDGYLWVGTQQGLARFDGLTFTVFTQHNTPDILNSQITSMAETGDGSLWIGTSYGLVRYHGRRFTTYTTRDGIRGRSGTVNAVCVAPDGSLWIGTQGGITRWQDGRFINDIDTSAYDTLGLRSVSVDHTGAMWINCGDYLLRHREGKFTRYEVRAGTSATRPQNVIEDAAGNVLAVTQRGLFRLENERFVPLEANADLSSRRVGAALADRDGNLWVGSVSGLDRWRAGRVVPYVDQHGNRLGVVDALFEDRENCLWVGTSSGLYRFTDRRGFSLSKDDRITNPLITAVAQSRDGALWIASWGGGVERFLNDEVTHFAPGNPLSHETITCIYQDPQGVMWLGTRGSSIDRLEGRDVRTFVYTSGVATSRPVTAMLAVSPEDFLVGISRRGLLTLRQGELVPVPEAAAVESETVWVIHQLRSGRLLMGTSIGLYERQADRRWTPLALPGLAGPVRVRALHEVDDGTVWLATEGHGLVRWRAERARAYDSQRGMLDDTLFSARDDGLGAVWISSARGLARIRIAELDAIDQGASVTLSPITFGRDDGLLCGATSGNGAPSAIQVTDGQILTATDIGVAVIDPRRLQANIHAPNVVIERAVADDQVLPYENVLRVPPGTNRLELTYTALSLVSPQRLRFRYQLVGSDPTWVEAGHARRATYTHLDPGRYTFRVLACNSDGIWNREGTAVGIEILPQFHQTLLFRILLGTLVVLLVASVVGWRLRRIMLRQQALARANAELDQRVRERTAELSRSNAEVKQRESLFRLIFEHAPVGVCWQRTDLGPDYHLNAAFRRILALPDETLPDATPIIRLVHPEDAARHAELNAAMHSGKADNYALEQRFVRADGTLVHALFAAAVVRDPQGRILQVIAILEDITARKLAEQELASTYSRLVDVSRLSGMAEVATGVLHNVGNVLTSVNVSATVLADGLRNSRIANVSRLAALLEQHAPRLAQFLVEDPRGQRVVPYLRQLADLLTSEHEQLAGEVASLRANVEHIKAIVARQQSLARPGGVLEQIAAADLFEDALEMNAMALTRHSVEIVRDFAPVPPLLTERHKVLQILINVIQNAKEAMKVGRPSGRRLELRLRADDSHVRFEIVDNGDGIAPANLTRIFEHGFTTRAGGHGFGLHSSAIAARQLGGTLTAGSAGPGAGATFVLTLPLVAPSGDATDVLPPAP